MDLIRLRDILRPHVIALKDAGTHNNLPTICRKLGLPAPDSEGSKRDKMSTSFDALSDADLPRVAERFLELHPPSPTVRNEIQDLLWSSSSTPEIPKRFRREIARALGGVELYLDTQRFDNLLDKLWVLDDDPMVSISAFLGGADHSLRAEIKQHVYRNPGDWSTEYLFDKLGAFEASDRRFALFLEGLASSEVRPDEAEQRHLVQIVNSILCRCGIEMRESDMEGGYPVFTVVSTHFAPRGRAKNLIFASSGFRDSVNNDIEIVTNADKVLVYDRPISGEGLRWRDLQSWWRDLRKIVDDDHAKTTLYRRLRDSLPKNSPPQTLLFDAFYCGFSRAVPYLPALLPEVWLHWDPKTVKERGADALLRFRMDFLLLLPHGVRVVLSETHHPKGQNSSFPSFMSNTSPGPAPSACIIRILSRSRLLNRVISTGFWKPRATSLKRPPARMPIWPVGAKKSAGNPGTNGGI